MKKAAVWFGVAVGVVCGACYRLARGAVQMRDDKGGGGGEAVTLDQARPALEALEAEVTRLSALSTPTDEQRSQLQEARAGVSEFKTLIEELEKAAGGEPAGVSDALSTLKRARERGQVQKRKEGPDGGGTGPGNDGAVDVKALVEGLASLVNVQTRQVEQSELQSVVAGAEVVDSEGRERLQLLRRSSVAPFLRCALGGAPPDGAEREAAAALKLVPSATGQANMPLQLLDPGLHQRVEQRAERREVRADAVSDLGAVAAGVTPRMWIDRVFLESVAAWAGVDMEAVPTGEALWSTLTGGATADMVAPEADVDADAVVIGTATLKPNRVASRYVYRLEDQARLGQLEPRLRADLRMGLTERVDALIMGGNARLATPAGLAGSGAATDIVYGVAGVIDAAESTTLNGALHDALIDGRYSPMLSGVKLGLAVELYKVLTTVALDAVDMFIYDVLRAQGVQMRSSPHFARKAAAAVAVGDDLGLVVRPNGLSGAAVCAVWPSLELVRDPFTDAKKGLVGLTATMLIDMAVNRPANFGHLNVGSLAA